MQFLGNGGGKIQFCVWIKLNCFLLEKEELTIFYRGQQLGHFDIGRSHFDNFYPNLNHLGTVQWKCAQEATKFIFLSGKKS